MRYELSMQMWNVYRLLINGDTRSEIASELRLSRTTVNNLLTGMQHITDSRNIPQLVAKLLPVYLDNVKMQRANGDDTLRLFTVDYQTMLNTRLLALVLAEDEIKAEKDVRKFSGYGKLISCIECDFNGGVEVLCEYKL